ncbi:MAG: hypothetical protein JEZ09_14025 [Salinivirgaceae bacterium]|nr:hypothetical protein [Salinivirgaceae bacterium]
MKLTFKVLIILLILIAAPAIGGLFLPKERMVTEMTMIDKMYFFILSDITNHWEEPSWRQNLDTIVQQDVIDGQDSWMEYYTNGDSVLLITQKTTETDYIRYIIGDEGLHLMRVITLADYKGRTAIRISEEVYEKNPYKRFMALIKDPTQERIQQFLSDLKEKNKPSEDGSDENSGW